MEVQCSRDERERDTCTERYIAIYEALHITNTIMWKNIPLHPHTNVRNSNVLYFREMVGRYIIILYRRCDVPIICEYVRPRGGICVPV